MNRIENGRESARHFQMREDKIKLLEMASTFQDSNLHLTEDITINKRNHVDGLRKEDGRDVQ